MYKIYCDGAYAPSRDQGGVGFVILNENMITNELIQLFCSIKPIYDNTLVFICIHTNICSLKQKYNTVVLIVICCLKQKYNTIVWIQLFAV